MPKNGKFWRVLKCDILGNFQTLWSCSARESFFGMGSPLSAGIPPPNALKGKSSFIFLQIHNFAWFWYKSTVSKLFWTDWPQIWPKIRNYFILSLYLKSLIFVQNSIKKPLAFYDIFDFLRQNCKICLNISFWIASNNWILV